MSNLLKQIIDLKNELRQSYNPFELSKLYALLDQLEKPVNTDLIEDWWRNGEGLLWADMSTVRRAIRSFLLHCKNKGIVLTDGAEKTDAIVDRIANHLEAKGLTVGDLRDEIDAIVTDELKKP